MNRVDLHALEEFLARAGLVVAMEDVYDFPEAARADVVGVRHDCDNVIIPAVHMAQWEHDHGYYSTYYVLHTSPYWRDKPLLRMCLDEIASLGHEIGIHNDAITVHRETGHEPARILHNAVEELRSYGHTIRSTVAHGNARCHVDHYVNDEMFTECRRDAYGDIGRLGITPVPLSEFGLEFDANWLPRGDYLSDSGGQWSQPFHDVASAWPAKGQLHMLVHPDHWADAFQPEKAAA